MKPKKHKLPHVQVRPSYTSAQAACARYFMLREGLGVAGSHPMDPDEVIKGTRTSTDKETLLEMLDLARALHRAGVVEGELSWHLLCVEYTRSDLPIAGARGGRNKLALLWKATGTRVTERDYLVRLAEVMRSVREELEHRRWIPRRTSYQRTSQSRPSL